VARRHLFKRTTEAREERFNTLPSCNGAVAQDLLSIEIICCGCATKGEGRLVPLCTTLMERGEARGTP
jgi:hypothetical protein